MLPRGVIKDRWWKVNQAELWTVQCWYWVTRFASAGHVKTAQRRRLSACYLPWLLHQFPTAFRFDLNVIVIKLPHENLFLLVSGSWILVSVVWHHIITLFRADWLLAVRQFWSVRSCLSASIWACVFELFVFFQVCVLMHIYFFFFVTSACKVLCICLPKQMQTDECSLLHHHFDCKLKLLLLLH